MEQEKLDKQELLKSLKDRKEILQDMLLSIGSEQCHKAEVSMVLLCNNVTKGHQTLAEYQAERRGKIRAQMEENARTYRFVKNGKWDSIM